MKKGLNLFLSIIFLLNFNLLLAEEIHSTNDTVKNSNKKHLIGTVPTDGISNYIFHNTDNGWFLIAENNSNTVIYIVESFNGNVQITFPIPPQQNPNDVKFKDDQVYNNYCFKLFPIPNNGELKVFINNSVRNFNLDDVEIIIGTVDAGILMTLKNVDLRNNNLYSIDTSTLPSGVYSISIEDHKSGKSMGTTFIKN